ncbi:hypothetical protein LCGC14_1553100 [marine sediment metagenome]|uniref:Uncharacterized protein n=1 Tax=marine sediment metagenome TaxID=412755 RepID=A0A0F9LQK4_9ZZZZ
MAHRNSNRIVIGLVCFCSKCTAELKPAACDDMNGDDVTCKKCGHTVEIQIGISVHSNSMENLRRCYDQMKESHDLIKELLSERNPV